MEQMKYVSHGTPIQRILRNLMLCTLFKADGKADEVTHILPSFEILWDKILEFLCIPFRA